MWKLTIEDDEGTKTLLPLVRDEYQVGRDEGNTIRLTERNISRRHATLKKANGGWELFDLDSYNGCFVNGQRVAGSTKLAHSDLVQVGDYRIFLSDDAAVTDDVGGTSTPSPQTMPSITVGVMENRIVEIVGPEPGKEFPLVGADVYTIGREIDCAVSINHPSVSRVHAEIRTLSGGRFEMLDRGSSNGVKVNGHDLRRALLEGGDLIELGDVKLRFLERGQAMRAGADASQQIEAMTSRPAQSVRPGSAKSKMPLILAGIGAVALIGAVAIVALSGGSGDSGAPAAAKTEDAAKKLVEAAKKASSAGDYEAAIAKLAEIPEGNPARKDPDVVAIWQRWADAAIRKAGETQDPGERKELLSRVAQNPQVDATRRSQASDLLAKTGGGTSIDNLPAAAAGASTAAPAPAATPTDAATGGAKAAPTPTEINLDVPPTAGGPLPGPGVGPTAKKDKKDEKKDDKVVEKKDDKAGTAPDPLSQDGETKMRKQLEGVVWSGKGSPEQIKMLKAICRHQNDRACADRANQMLQKQLRRLQERSPARAVGGAGRSAVVRCTPRRPRR